VIQWLLWQLEWMLPTTSMLYQASRMACCPASGCYASLACLCNIELVTPFSSIQPWITSNSLFWMLEQCCLCCSYLPALPLLHYPWFRSSQCSLGAHVSVAVSALRFDHTLVNQADSSCHSVDRPPEHASTLCTASLVLVLQPRAVKTLTLCFQHTSVMLAGQLGSSGWTLWWLWRKLSIQEAIV